MLFVKRSLSVQSVEKYFIDRPTDLPVDPRVYFVLRSGYEIQLYWLKYSLLKCVTDGQRANPPILMFRFSEIKDRPRINVATLHLEQSGNLLVLAIN